MTRRTHLSLVTGMTDDETLTDYETWLRSWGAAERTIIDRLRYLRARAKRWPGGLRGATERTLQAALSDPAYSRWTRTTYYNHLCSFYGWAHEAGRVTDDPTARLRRPTPPRGRPRPLSEAEVARVLAASSGNVYAWVVLGLYAGLRAHEIAKIRGEDVAEAVYVEGKGGQQAMIPTHARIATLAGSHPAAGWWFPSPVYPGRPVAANTVTRGVGALFGDLGIDGSVHRCRHTYATRLLRGGANLRVVQTLMRHQTISSTERYTAVDEDERRAAVNLLAA